MVPGPQKMLTVQNCILIRPIVQQVGAWRPVGLECAQDYTASTPMLQGGGKGRLHAANTGFASSRTLILLHLESQP